MITSKAAHEAVAFALDPPKEEAPADLTAEQTEIWRQIVARLPADWFGADNAPVLRELVRHISYSRQVAEELAELRKRSLNVATPLGAKSRSIFRQLLDMHEQQSRLIASLSTKLRLTNQTRTDDRVSEAQRDAATDKPKPWANKEMPEAWKLPVRQRDKNEGLRS